MRQFHIYLYGPSQGPIPTSFEEAEARLTQLPSLYFEPDGSFVWTADSGAEKIDGMIYDARGQIQYCDLHARCSLSIWRQLREAIAGDCEQELEALVLPSRVLQKLQSFEQDWPNG